MIPYKIENVFGTMVLLSDDGHSFDEISDRLEVEFPKVKDEFTPEIWGLLFKKLDEWKIKNKLTE